MMKKMKNNCQSNVDEHMSKLHWQEKAMGAEEMTEMLEIMGAMIHRDHQP